MNRRSSSISFWKRPPPARARTESPICPFKPSRGGCSLTEASLPVALRRWQLHPLKRTRMQVPLPSARRRKKARRRAPTSRPPSKRPSRPLPPGYVPERGPAERRQRDARRCAAGVAAAGLPISTVPLPTRKEPEVQVSAVTLPRRSGRASRSYVEVVDRRQSRRRGRHHRSIAAHTRSFARRKPIKKGENRFRFQQTIDKRAAGPLHGPHPGPQERHAARQQHRERPGLHRRQAARADRRERSQAHPRVWRPPWSRKTSRSICGRRRACPTIWPTCRTTSC